jgi:hypothetical protein
MDEFWFISKNIELVGMPKIYSRVDFFTVPICLRRCREFCVEMRVFPESQTFLLVLETAEIPQNLLKARSIAENLWYGNQIPPMGAR